MVPNLAKRGTSFVGAAKYYLHDKRKEGEYSRTTTDRIAWTQTRGVMTDDAYGAINIMRATAESQDDLKRQAGVRLTGNKSKGCVLAYSLSWSPDENGQIDKAEMLRAVDTSLKALGAQEHQAVIVAHNDEPHPHVHVILNLVNQHNGKNLPQSYTKKKLDKWAYEYRKERGEENTYCVDRTKKHEAIEGRKRGQNPQFVKGTKAKYQPSSEAAICKVSDKADRVTAKVVREQQKSKDAELSSFGKKQAQVHQSEWSEISSKYRTKKARNTTDARAEKKAISEEIYLQGKPYYVEMLKAHRAELSAFNQREKRVLGKLNNMVEAVTHTARLGRPENGNVVTQLFSTIASKDKRQEWIKRKHEKQIRDFKKDQAQQIRQAVAKVESTYRERNKSAYEIFQVERSALITKQNREREELKARWKDRNESRKAAFALLSKAAQTRQEAKTHQIDDSDAAEVRKEFEIRSRPKRTRKPRTRKRTKD